MHDPSRRTFLATLAAGTLGACMGDDATPPATRYRTAVDRVLGQYRFPGALVSVRYPGDPDWTAAVGLGNIAANVPLRLDDHFSIRSVTKSFTVTLILQLVRDQAITLDDPIERWVPGIPNGRDITLADLAGNQSGIADYSGAPGFLDVFVRDFQHVFTEQDLVAYAIPLSPRFEPRAQYQYCNTNTVLLGMVAARVTGLPLGELLRARIFAPLGLGQTTYPLTVPLPAPSPTPYAVDVATGATEALELISPTALAGSGGMVSTLLDLATWAQALGDGRLIGPALQRERVERSRIATHGPEYERYGLGIGLLQGWIGHTGSGLGFQAAAMYDPVSRAAIAVGVNATPVGGRPELNIAQEIFAALADVVATR